MRARRSPGWLLFTLLGFLRERVGAYRVSLPFDEAGARIVVDLRTGLGRRMYRYGVLYEDPDFAVLRAVLRPGDVFLDCGANVGAYTLAASKLVGGGGVVISFEASPDTRASLVQNIAENALANVRVEPFAVSDARGRATLFSRGVNDGFSSFAPEVQAGAVAVDVETVPLDSVWEECGRPSVRLIKIDVEGAEFRVLRGAEETLTTTRPWILIEIEPAHLQRQGASEAMVREFLVRCGYEEIAASWSSPNVLFAHTAADQDDVVRRLRGFGTLSNHQ
jgi:FkbM family methyltransferase